MTHTHVRINCFVIRERDSFIDDCSALRYTVEFVNYWCKIEVYVDTEW